MESVVPNLDLGAPMISHNADLETRRKMLNKTYAHADSLEKFEKHFSGANVIPLAPLNQASYNWATVGSEVRAREGLIVRNMKRDIIKILCRKNNRDFRIV